MLPKQILVSHQLANPLQIVSFRLELNTLRLFITKWDICYLEQLTPSHTHLNKKVSKLVIFMRLEINLHLENIYKCQKCHFPSQTSTKRLVLKLIFEVQWHTSNLLSSKKVIYIFKKLPFYHLGFSVDILCWKLDYKHSSFLIKNAFHCQLTLSIVCHRDYNRIIMWR